MHEILSQSASLAGAFLILLAYYQVQRGRWTEKQAAYLWMNAAGGGLLLFTAILTRQIGFIILEGSWMGMSLVGLIQLGISNRRP